ncbi:3-isopropylmalate dehydratase small subunit [Eoetvoesiella caeni]|uniref:3-isopropylmalate dehydratase small subunit n=1 Tax=Eoetvoesiella caeni TaxID=645616 RepID=A0A366GZV0_9BURK|nr:3-isopropylmalate dehydratase small subunit [Eoetvoesiella caeni]MCI2811250.1 3-isopropylmalate dehydratase small subunit [Eoetvoesiella caeni]NYT57141.1 3-isopropylmalate dehydratase small subunit [Eoetvoesiella caeni]RBP33653.1 3-isopropylmalate dehydratase small subunit [Eoetvoesiella caeni]
MQAFTSLDGLVAPLDRNNVDTDAIVPKQFLKSIARTGFGRHLFDELRFMDDGELGQDPDSRQKNPDFSLNQPRYQGAQILLTRENFGCGSSREHAPWALYDYGFRAIVAVSFADIFYDNCFKNGILPVSLDAAIINQLFDEVQATPGYRLSIDLAEQTVKTPSGQVLDFTLDPTRKRRLLEGLDDIAITLADADAIRSYEQVRIKQEPWLFEIPR